jgi:hypothetical protein
VGTVVYCVVIVSYSIFERSFVICQESTAIVVPTGTTIAVLSCFTRLYVCLST